MDAQIDLDQQHLITRLKYYRARINVLSSSSRDALTIGSILHILRELRHMTLDSWHLEESLIYIEIENLSKGDGVIQTAAGDLLCKWEREGLISEEIIQDPEISSNNTQATKRDATTQTSRISNYYRDQKLISLRKNRKIKNTYRVLKEKQLELRRVQQTLKALREEFEVQKKGFFS